MRLDGVKNCQKTAAIAPSEANKKLAMATVDERDSSGLFDIGQTQILSS
jgi:hypothetical protein